MFEAYPARENEPLSSDEVDELNFSALSLFLDRDHVVAGSDSFYQVSRYILPDTAIPANSRLAWIGVGGVIVAEVPGQIASDTVVLPHRRIEVVMQPLDPRQPRTKDLYYVVDTDNDRRVLIVNSSNASPFMHPATFSEGLELREILRAVHAIVSPHRDDGPDD